MNYPKAQGGVDEITKDAKADKLKLFRHSLETNAQMIVNQFDNSDDTKDVIRSIKALRMNLGCLFAQTEEKDLNRERDEE